MRVYGQKMLMKSSMGAFLDGSIVSALSVVRVTEGNNNPNLLVFLLRNPRCHPA
jgi:hypothetical protein